MSKYNYFIEMAAVFDNIFKTNILELVTGGKVKFVAGADGWDRAKLIKTSVNAVLGFGEINPVTRILVILFGFGAGSAQIFLPHNLFIGLWLDFGLIPMLLYLALVMVIAVYGFRQLKRDKAKGNKSINPYFVAVLTYFIVNFFGSLIIVHYIYFIAILGLFFGYFRQN